MACGLTAIADDGNGSVIEERFRDERWMNDNGKMGEKRTGSRKVNNNKKTVAGEGKYFYYYDTIRIARTI